MKSPSCKAFLTFFIISFLTLSAASTFAQFNSFVINGKGTRSDELFNLPHTNSELLSPHELNRPFDLKLEAGVDLERGLQTGDGVLPALSKKGDRWVKYHSAANQIPNTQFGPFSQTAQEIDFFKHNLKQPGHWASRISERDVLVCQDGLIIKGKHAMASYFNKPEQVAKHAPPFLLSPTLSKVKIFAQTDLKAILTRINEFYPGNNRVLMATANMNESDKRSKAPIPTVTVRSGTSLKLGDDSVVNCSESKADDVANGPAAVVNSDMAPVMGAVAASAAIAGPELIEVQADSAAVAVNADENKLFSLLQQLHEVPPVPPAFIAMGRTNKNSELRKGVIKVIDPHNVETTVLQEFHYRAGSVFKVEERRPGHQPKDKYYYIKSPDGESRVHDFSGFIKEMIKSNKM